jgi:hypothetical protein
MSEGLNIPPKSFYWTAGAALLWNLIGIYNYIAQVTMSNEALAALPDAQRAFFENQPSWVTGAFALAVNAGAVGCLLLLLRKAWALPVFMLSLVCVLLQSGYDYFVADAMNVFGAAQMILPIVIIAIGAYLIKYSKDAAGKNWIG